MTTPQEIIADRLGEGLDVTGTVAMDQLGVVDAAGASAPPVEIDLSKATPMNADVTALEQRIAAQQAAQLAAPPPPPPVVERPALSSSVASDLRAVLDSVYDRLAAIERKLGL